MQEVGFNDLEGPFQLYGSMNDGEMRELRRDKTTLTSERKGVEQPSFNKRSFPSGQGGGGPKTMGQLFGGSCNHFETGESFPNGTEIMEGRELGQVQDTSHGISDAWGNRFNFKHKRGSSKEVEETVQKDMVLLEELGPRLSSA